MSKRGFSNEELELDWGGRTRPEDRAAAPEGEGNGGDGQPGKGAPGDPRYMSVELRWALAQLLEGPWLRVKQLKEWGEILTGWETRNRYEAQGADGRFMLFIGEAGSGLGASLARNLWPFRRIRLECMTQTETLALAVERPWTFFFARAEVYAWDGRLMGHIQQRFGFFRRRLEVCTPAGQVLASVEGPFWKPWTFNVLRQGEQLATIRKQWSGLGTELFSDADTFGIEFQPGLTDGRLRQLLLATLLLVDLTWFENKNRSNGSSGLLKLLGD